MRDKGILPVIDRSYSVRREWFTEILSRRIRQVARGDECRYWEELA
jgi:hypothetical protein